MLLLLHIHTCSRAARVLVRVPMLPCVRVRACVGSMQRGLDPNSPDACNSDRTPLHLACSNKNLEAVKVLIAANADPAIGMKVGIPDPRRAAPQKQAV